MLLLDCLNPMIKLVDTAGVGTETEIFVPIDAGAAPSTWFGRLFSGSLPPKVFRVRNSNHPRGLAERRNLDVVVKDPGSARTLSLQLGYRVSCLPGRERELAANLSQGPSPQAILDFQLEGWVRLYGRRESDFLNDAGAHADRLANFIEAEGESCGLAIRAFFEHVPHSRRISSFSLPVSFKGETDPVSVSVRLSIQPGSDPGSDARSRLNEAPDTLEADLKRLIEAFCGRSVLRDSAERQSDKVLERIQEHLSEWLRAFGLEAVVEAFQCPPRSAPDVAHTIRVDGFVELGHYKWKVRTTMEIEAPEKFIQQKRERQITDVHVWLGEHYPDIFWRAIRGSSGDQDRFEQLFDKEVRDITKQVGYTLMHFELQRVLSVVEQDARRHHLQDHLRHEEFLDRRIETTFKKIENAYDASVDEDDDGGQIKRYEDQLQDLQKKKDALIDEIARTRAETKNLLLPATTTAIGSEKKWKAIEEEPSGDAQASGQEKRGAAAGSSSE